MLWHAGLKLSHCKSVELYPCDFCHASHGPWGHKAHNAKWAKADLNKENLFISSLYQILAAKVVNADVHLPQPKRFNPIKKRFLQA